VAVAILGGKEYNMEADALPGESLDMPFLCNALEIVV
jgi:hypothetical protein